MGGRIIYKDKYFPTRKIEIGGKMILISKVSLWNTIEKDCHTNDKRAIEISKTVQCYVSEEEFLLPDDVLSDILLKQNL